MKRISKYLAGIICIVMLAVSLPVMAEPAPELTTEEALSLMDAVATQLKVYGRYDSITERSLYRGALEKILKDNPQMYETVLKGMLESLDKYSEYYSPEEAEALMESITGEIVGIGVTIDFSNPDAAVIVSVIPDTPAERAGLKVGDIFVSADGQNLRGVKSELLLSLVRGEAGSTVVVEVERNGMILSFEMVREPIIGTSVTTELFEEDGKGVMYIRVYGFVNNTAEKFREALQLTEAAGIDNVIIDLRDNGGGLLDQTIEMADCIVPEGKTITTEDHKIQGLNKVYKATNCKKYQGNVMVLINENSASASEVLAAALHENGVATLIGDRSFGKGTIQTLNGLATGGIIKYTVGYYLTPLGNNINGIGLEPDISISNSKKNVDRSRYGNFGYTKVYNIGDSGEEVKTAKEILKFFEIFQGEINDVYDKDLYYAVASFQARAGLFSYGVLDLTTQLQINNHLEIAKITVDEQIRTAFEQIGMTYPYDEYGQRK